MREEKPQLADLRVVLHRVRSKSGHDGMKTRAAVPADLVEVLKGLGAEESGVQIDSWGLPVVGYADCIREEDAHKENVRYLVWRIEEGNG